MTHFLSAARRIINDGATLADVSSDILVLAGMSLVFLIIGAFLLKDKPFVVFSTGYSADEENSQVLNILDHFVLMNKAKRVSRFLVGAFSQCYTCKFGRTCTDGNIVKDNGIVDKVTPDMLPREFDKQSEALAKCENAAHLLNDILSIALR